MKKSAISAALALGTLVYAFSASADERLVRFDGGIGSQPLRSGATPNVVQNVNPGGIPWVISSLRADVRTDGSIKAEGRGLLLGGGNGVGTPGGQSVRARLFCGTLAFDSALVPLDADGDFRIEGELTPVTANTVLPNPCPQPILLIVSGGGNWFAAGIPKN
jgi:hypothetical protein